MKTGQDFSERLAELARRVDTPKRATKNTLPNQFVPASAGTVHFYSPRVQPGGRGLTKLTLLGETKGKERELGVWKWDEDWKLRFKPSATER